MSRIKYRKEGWPTQNDLSPAVADCWQYRAEKAVENGLLMKSARIIISKELRENILNKILDGHLDNTKLCTVAGIVQLIKQCQQLVNESTNRQEPLIPSDFFNAHGNKSLCIYST